MEKIKERGMSEFRLAQVLLMLQAMQIKIFSNNSRIGVVQGKRE